LATGVHGVASEAELCVLTASPGVEAEALLSFLEARAVRPSRVVGSGEAAAAGVSVWVPLQDVHGLGSLAEAVKTAFGGQVRLSDGVGSVTCVGTGLLAGGVGRRVLACAQAVGARVQGLEATPLSVALLVDREHLEKLTRALHAALVARP
jgi:aspartokinase